MIPIGIRSESQVFVGSGKNPAPGEIFAGAESFSKICKFRCRGSEMLWSDKEGAGRLCFVCRHDNQDNRGHLGARARRIPWPEDWPEDPSVGGPANEGNESID